MQSLEHKLLPGLPKFYYFLYAKLQPAVDKEGGK